jgi:hypothetical protein
VATAQRAMRAERAFGLGQMDVLLRGQPTTQLGNEGLDGWDKPMETYRRLVPTGWLRFEQANLARTMQSMLLPDAEIEQHRIDPRKVQRAQAAFEKSLQPPWKSVPQHRVFCHLLIPALGRSYSKFAYAQTVADQAMLACALERYRLAKGQFPAALDALVPACLEKIPPDVITGEPMHYRRAPDGQFLLWSVGWNEEDEDGTPGDSASDDKRGDWVWQYPSK